MSEDWITGQRIPFVPIDKDDVMGMMDLKEGMRLTVITPEGVTTVEVANNEEQADGSWTLTTRPVEGYTYGEAP